MLMKSWSSMAMWCISDESGNRVHCGNIPGEGLATSQLSFGYTKLNVSSNLVKWAAQSDYSMVGFLQNRYPIVVVMVRYDEILNSKDGFIDFCMQYDMLNHAIKYMQSWPKFWCIIIQNLSAVNNFMQPLLTISFKMSFEISQNLVALWELRICWWSEDWWLQNQYLVSGWDLKYHLQFTAKI